MVKGTNKSIWQHLLKNSVYESSMVFFQNLFFFTQYEKNFYGEQSMFMGERFPSFFFFFDLPWKRYSRIETGHVQFSNIFSHEKPRTFRLKKKMKQKKTEALKEKKNLPGGFISILDTFENTRGWKYSINSFCGQKNNIDLN